MTLATPSTQLWKTMPGWGVTANLLPPEIVTARRLRVLRKIMLAVIGAVLVLGAAGYGYAMMQKRSAESDLAAAENATTQLQGQQRKYAEVVQIGGTVSQIKTQLATLMTADVDFAKVIDAVLAQQPRGGAVTQLQLSLTAVGSTGTGAAPQSTASGVLDTSGRVHIGAISLTGTTGSMADVPLFVTRLSTVPGIVSVYPTSQQANDKTIEYTVQLTVTDQVLTHRYDVAGTAASGTTPSTPGGK